MEDEFHVNYCDCKDWGSGKLKNLNAVFEAYPGVCPYCKAKLKTRLREIGIWIGEGISISLKELKELLEEIS